MILLAAESSFIGIAAHRIQRSQTFTRLFLIRPLGCTPLLSKNLLYYFSETNKIYYMEILTRRKKCPKCGEGSLHTRVRRHHLVKMFLFWLPLKRYKCDMCYEKTYIMGDVWQHLYVVDVDTKRNVLLLERLKPGLAINSLKQQELEALRMQKIAKEERLHQLDRNEMLIPDYIAEYTFNTEADLFLRRVIEEGVLNDAH